MAELQTSLRSLYVRSSHAASGTLKEHSAFFADLIMCQFWGDSAPSIINDARGGGGRGGPGARTSPASNRTTHEIRANSSFFG